MEYRTIIEDDLATEDVKRFADTARTCLITYAVKNADYGNSFHEGMTKIGLPYGVGRIFDKTNRLVNLSDPNKTPNNESIADTVLDLACYAIMLYNELK